ncbi:MAG: hypothetical protein AABZ39_02745 [Spirochaetota bacterium]
MDLSKVRRYSIQKRPSKVHSEEAAHLPDPAKPLSAFFDTLPDTLKAKDMKALIHALRTAKKNGKGIILGMGAHVIKCGLNPIVIDLMERGFISHMVVNGACAVHDFELAYAGATSEDVGAALEDGTFGMAEETGKMVNGALVNAQDGFGSAIGKMLADGEFPHRDRSLFYNAYKRKIGVSVAVAIGTDIVHQHPEARGEDIGRASYADFLKLADAIPSLHGGGVFLTFGSAVIIPEVFLKALTIARNVKGPVTDFTTAVFDMNVHYRPSMNIVSRPTAKSGAGYYFVGHHEIMLPLLYAGLVG